MRKFLLFLLILLFIPISISTGQWTQPGSDSQTSYVQDNGQTLVSENRSLSSLSQTITSSVVPLVADLDNDEINEIIIFRNGEVRIYTSVNYTYVTAYVNTSIQVFDNSEAIDFDGDNKREIVFITNTSTGYDFFTLGYNGTDLIPEKHIANVEGSNGLNCLDLYGTTAPECCYVGHDHHVYCYDNSNTQNKTTPTINITGSEGCFMGARPHFEAIDANSGQDMMFFYTSGCNTLLIFSNDNDGTFSLYANITSVSGYGFNQVVIDDLDGGADEIILTASNYCSAAIDSCGGSTIQIVDSVALTQCTNSVKNSGYNFNSAYLTGLTTCSTDFTEGFCDVDHDDFPEVFVLAVLPESAVGNSFSPMYIFDSDCTLLSNNFTSILANNPSGSNQLITNTTRWNKPIWANFDADLDTELWAWTDIIKRNTSSITVIGNTSFYTNYRDLNTYLLSAEISFPGDGQNDLLYQNSTSKINIITFASTNQAPSIESGGFVMAPQNPVCLDTNVVFSVDASDPEGSGLRLAADCYNNGTIINGTLTTGDIEVQCNYRVTGAGERDYSVTIFVQDETNPTDRTVNATFGVDIEDSAYCHNIGDGTSTSLGDDPGFQDMSDSVDNIWDAFGLKSSKSKTAFGLMAVFFFTVGIIGAAAAKNWNLTVGHVMIIDILFILVLTIFGLLPIWIIIFFIIISSIIVGWKAIHPTVSGG